MLSERWRPKRSRELAGIEPVVREVAAWLSGWRRGSALLLHGPPGCGKTVLAHALAADTGRDVISINEIEDIHAIVGATTQTSLTTKQRLILVNDVDAMAVEKKDATSELLSAISRSRWPIIFTAIDLWEPAIRPLKQRCMALPMRPISTPAIARRLKDIADAEKISTDPQLLQAAAATAAGDMRAGLNFLELLAVGADGTELAALDKARSPFELLAALFKGSSMTIARRAIDEADLDIDATFAWLESNILTEWQQPGQAALAFEVLSRADMMRRRDVDTAKALLATFVVLRSSKGWTRYGPPDRQALMKSSRGAMADMDAAATALAPALHCSKAKVRNEYLPFLRHYV